MQDEFTQGYAKGVQAMSISYEIKDLPTSAADVNLDMYGYDSSKWIPVFTDHTNARKGRQVFQLSGDSRQFPVLMERSSDRTQKLNGLPSVKCVVQVTAPITQTDSVTTVEAQIGHARVWIGFHVTDLDVITPAMIVKQLITTLDTILPTVTAGAADAGVVSSLMSGNVSDLG